MKFTRSTPRDLNDDGLVDVALATYSGEIWVCLQNGGGSWTEIEVAGTGSSIGSLRLADFDGDGKDDIAVSLYDQGDILWFKNPLPGGSTWESNLVHQSDSPREVIPADMDDDGDPDILCASEGQGVFICWNQDGTGTSWSVEPVDPSLLPAHNVAAADMDNNGTMDVTASGGDAGGIFLYNAPLWEKHTVVDSVGVIEDIAAGDLNGDGLPDVAATSLTNFRTRTYENPGDPPGNGPKPWWVMRGACALSSRTWTRTETWISFPQARCLTTPRYVSRARRVSGSYTSPTLGPAASAT